MNRQKAHTLKEQSRTTFNAQASTYDTSIEGDHARKLYPYVACEVEQAAAILPAPRILDLGCGTGALAKLIVDTLPNCQLTCIDLSPKMLEMCHAKLDSRACILLEDAERLPFHDGSFDIVYCNDSFHHYPEPKRAAFQAWRVLAPGGTFIIGDTWQPNPARAIMNAWIRHSHGGDVRIYSENEMRAILGTWFNTVSWKNVGQTACISVAHKA